MKTLVLTTPLLHCRDRNLINISLIYTCLVCSFPIPRNRSFDKLGYSKFAISTRNDDTHGIKTHRHFHVFNAKFSPNPSPDTAVLQHNERIIPQRQNFVFQSLCYEAMNKFELIFVVTASHVTQPANQEALFYAPLNFGHVRLTREVWV